MENFQSLGLSEALLNTLAAMQYKIPTAIQAQTIPSALQGLDVLGTAQTGTGKTAAYGIPLISHLLNSKDSTTLVLTPTRELAVQVLALLEQILGRKSGIRSSLIIGGDSMTKQLSQLSANPRIIVGTPGRINDHLARGTLKLDKTNFLVLDETDRMLDMGFGIQLEEIAKFLPHKRQTLMFSATLPHNIQTLAARYLKNDAVRVTVGSTTAAADTIKQEIVRTSETEKYGVLIEQLDLREGAVIIFVKTKIATEKLATKLRDHGYSADAIHGDLRQRNRERVIRSFRNRKHRILVATDVAARGLDISHVECVINHDLPQCEEDFIHRIGRTGRAGLEGTAVSLITPQDHLKWKNICKMMNPGVKLDSSFDEPKTASRSRSNSRRPEFKKFGSNTNRGTDSFRPRTEGRSFERSGSSEGFRPRTEGRSFERPSNSEGFRPRTEGRSFERSNNSEGFRPRTEGRSFERPGNSEGFKPRTEGARYPRSNASDSFKPRTEGRNFERPSSSEGFKPRTEGTRYPRSNASDSFRPRTEDRRFGKSDGGSNSRSDGATRRPSGDNRKPFGQFKPRKTTFS